MREVLNKAAIGDKKSFDFLVEKFNKNMINIADIYVNQEAEDIVQNVWVQIYEKKESLKRVENIENWLFYVVKNSCIDFLRKHRGKRNISKISIEANQEYIDSLIRSDDILETILKRHSKVMLYQKIISLGELYYMPIILHYFKDLSLNEISKMLDIPISTIKSRLYTARQLLKKELTKNNYLN